MAFLTVKYVGKMINNRVVKDKDAPIALTGYEGDGKSTLAILLAMAADPYFDLEVSELYSPTEEEITQKIKMLPKFSAIIADEAINILYKLNWASKLQKYINKLFSVCRQENKIIFFCMPRFTDFNEFFRNHRLKIWIHIIDPISNEKQSGHAVIFAKGWSPVSIDPWWLKEMQKTIDDYAQKKRMKEIDFSLEDKIDCLSKMRTYVGILEFGWAEKKLWDKYLELKTKNKYSGFTELDSTEDKGKQHKRDAAIHQVAVRELTALGKTQAEIAKLFGKTQPWVCQMLNKIEPASEKIL